MDYKVLNKVNERNRKSRGLHVRLHSIEVKKDFCLMEDKVTHKFTDAKISKVINDVFNDQMHVTNLSAIREAIIHYDPKVQALV